MGSLFKHVPRDRSWGIIWDQRGGSESREKETHAWNGEIVSDSRENSKSRERGTHSWN